MRLSFVVAMSENRVIGVDNQLPWRLPEDLKWFKRVTLGHPIVMGRKTFESIGRTLPGRTNIVVTRQKTWQNPDGVVVRCNLDDALDKAQNQAHHDGVEDVFVIGGEELFRQTLHKVDRLYLTQVHAQIDGDAFFPEFDESQWREIERENHLADQQNPYNYSFIVLDRCPR